VYTLVLGAGAARDQDDCMGFHAPQELARILGEAIDNGSKG
jgi:hypothetical protein